jgi:hypothetical protein
MLAGMVWCRRALLFGGHRAELSRLMAAVAGLPQSLSARRLQDAATVVRARRANRTLPRRSGEARHLPAVKRLKR